MNIKPIGLILLQISEAFNNNDDTEALKLLYKEIGEYQLPNHAIYDEAYLTTLTLIEQLIRAQDFGSRKPK